MQETNRTTHTDTTTHCRTQRRNRLTSKRSKPQPPHTRGTLHRRLRPLYTEKHLVSCSGFLPKTKPMQHSYSHYNAICKHRCNEVPYTSPAAATLHGKTLGFVLRLSPQNKAHATFMQPFQCDLQARVQNTHRTTHTDTTTHCRTQRRNRLTSKRSKPQPPHRRGTLQNFIAGCSHFTRKNTRFRAPASSAKQSPCNIHAAIPMRSATIASKHAKNYARRHNHSLQNTEEEPIDLETIQAATAAHTRYLIHRRLQPLYTEKHLVSCSGFLPKTKPMQHSCSHSNAICQHSFKTRIELCTQTQPLIAEHRGETD